MSRSFFKYVNTGGGTGRGMTSKTFLRKQRNERSPRRKTVAIGGRRSRKEIRLATHIYAIYGTNVMSAQLLEASLLGVGTVLRLEMDAWSMVK